MTKVRSREDIMADIIALVQEPRLKTHIMYKANLSYEQSSYYIPMMQSAGLIRNTSDNRWAITGKGQKFLTLYEESKSLIAQVSPMP
jgi:predicted transcriptional regulator